MATIITKNSSTTSAVPAAGDLVAGELAVNTADKKLFTKNGSTIVKIVGSLGNQEANDVAITGGTITGMGTPSGSSDVAPKSYVDGLISTGASNASAAAASATAAATSATNAASSASAASTSASNASTSATNAASAQTAAEAARDATLTAYDNFDDRYLGAKTSDPSVDNDGNALVAGTLYFNSVTQVMMLYTGSAWVAAYVSGANYLAAANNLSDLANAGTARTNLGVDIGTNVQAYNANLTTWAGKTAPSGTVVGDTDTQTLTNKTLTNPTVTNYVETPYSANSGTAITLALTNGTVQIITLTGNATITMPTAVAGKSFLVMLKQDATGSRTVTWPAAVKWPSSTAPTITATASKMDVYSFVSDGTYWYGGTGGQNYL